MGLMYYYIAIASFMAVIGIVFAAKRRRRDRNFVAIPFEQQLPLLTLANDTALAVSLLGGNFVDPIWVHSVDASWAIHELAAGEGPIACGYTHSDLSAAEIGEALEVATVLGRNVDIIGEERRRRPVRKVGSFAGQLAQEHLFDGAIRRRKIKFLVGTGKALSMYCVNRGDATPLTTGAIVTVTGTIYGSWR